MDLSREGLHHRTLRWRDHQPRGAVRRHHRRDPGPRRGRLPRVGRPRVPRRAAHPAVQLVGRLQQRLAELVPRPGGRGAHDARHRRHAGLQLHRQGRRRVGVHRRHLGHGRQLHHRLRAGEPAHPGVAFLQRLGRHGRLCHAVRRGPGAELALHLHVPAAHQRVEPADLLHGPEGRRGPGEEVRHDRHPALPERGRGRYGGRHPEGLRGAARHQRRGGRGRGRRDRCGDGEGHHPLHESGGHRGQHPLLPDRGRGGRLHLRFRAAGAAGHRRL